MRVPFIDREREMKALKDFDEGLAIVYGRRRIGKTRLLLELIKEKKGAFWEAFVGSYEELSKSFAEAVRKELNTFVPYDLLEALKSLRGSGLTVVLDEFQYLAEADKGFNSKLKRLVDKGLGFSLIVSGSTVSFIEKELLGQRSPLFGRAKLIMKLKPLPFIHAKKFWKMEGEEALKAYSAIGGTPAYLAQTYSCSSLRDLLRKAFSYGSPPLRRGGVLLSRGELQEARDV